VENIHAMYVRITEFLLPKFGGSDIDPVATCLDNGFEFALKKLLPIKTALIRVAFVSKKTKKTACVGTLIKGEWHTCST